MNITQEPTGDLTATIKIELVKDDYENQVNTILKDYQRKAAMPGFRPGKVPMGMIKKMYGKAIMADEINKIISENLHGYLTENNVKTIGHPLPNEDRQEMIDFDKQESFSFYFDIGLQPEVDTLISDKIKIDYYQIRVDEESVDKYIADLRKKNGIPSNPEVSEEGDILRGKIVELDKEGNEQEGGISHETTISTDLIKVKASRKKFVGISPGDDIVFNPMKAMEDETQAARMLGIDAAAAGEIKGDFRFTVENITRFEPAAMDEDFFTSIFPGSDIKDEQAFREKLAEQLRISFGQESDRLFMRHTADKLIDDSGISLPDDFLKRWLVESGEASVEEEQINEHYDEYARALKWQLIESKIVADHNIQVTADDIREQIMGYFRAPGELDEETRKRLNDIADNIMQNQEEVKRIYDQLLDTRMRDLLKSTLKLKNKEVSYDEFIKLATETK